MPHRKFKNEREALFRSFSLFVSIPHRKFKNDTMLWYPIFLCGVSIPHRKFKNIAFKLIYAYIIMFPSLIGSSKTNLHHFANPVRIKFPSLIGSSKTDLDRQIGYSCS